MGIAYAYHFHQGWFRGAFGAHRRRLIVAGSASLLPAFCFPIEASPILWTAGLTLFALGSGALLIGVVLLDVPRTGVAAALGLVGTHSYSIYLSHMPVIRWAIPALERSLDRELDFLVRVPLYVAGSIALGMVMARLVEIPALRLRDRWFPGRPAGLAPPWPRPRPRPSPQSRPGPSRWGSRSRPEPKWRGSSRSTGRQSAGSGVLRRPQARPRGFQYESPERTSPPARVARACQRGRATLSRAKATWPSA